jgi:hypothetical protein
LQGLLGHRARLTCITGLAATLFAASAQAANKSGCTEFGDQRHTAGFVLDAGKGQDSLGLRYLHEHTYGEACDGLGSMLWAGYGAEVRAAMDRAMVGYLVGRAGVGGDTGGVALELGFGGGSDFSGSSSLAAIGSVLYSAYYFDLGVSYQLPIAAERPPWLGGFQFALRVHVPFATHARYERRRPRK